MAAKKAELAMREASLGINQKAAPAQPVVAPLSALPAFSTDVMEKNKKAMDLAALPPTITNILFSGGPQGPLTKTPLPSKLPMPPLPLGAPPPPQMGPSQIPQIPSVGASQMMGGTFPQSSLGR